MEVCIGELLRVYMSYASFSCADCLFIYFLYFLLFLFIPSSLWLLAIFPYRCHQMTIARGLDHWREESMGLLCESSFFLFSSLVVVVDDKAWCDDYVASVHGDTDAGVIWLCCLFGIWQFYLCGVVLTSVQILM